MQYGTRPTAAMPTPTVLSLFAALCLLLCTLSSFGAAEVCSDRSCPVDLGSQGCSLCSSNSSQCDTAWQNTTGAYCGQSLLISRQSDRHYYYSACCPTHYPSVPNAYVYTDQGVTYDVTSFWCTQQNPAAIGGSTHLTWLWWLLASVGGSVLVYGATWLYRHHQARTAVTSQQQQWGGQAQQELLGQPGPWSDEAAERQQQAIRQSLMPGNLSPGTYAQMP